MTRDVGYNLKIGDKLRHKDTKQLGTVIQVDKSSRRLPYFIDWGDYGNWTTYELLIAYDEPYSPIMEEI
jgi:hypothetical protein